LYVILVILVQYVHTCKKKQVNYSLQRFLNFNSRETQQKNSQKLSSLDLNAKKLANKVLKQGFGINEENKEEGKNLL
jgi:hypothetical protein